MSRETILDGEKALTVGEKWHNEGDRYVEELTVEGFAANDVMLAKGEPMIPKDDDTMLEVRIINNVSAKHFPTEMPYSELKSRFDRGEADMSENWW